MVKTWVVLKDDGVISSVEAVFDSEGHAEASAAALNREEAESRDIDWYPGDQNMNGEPVPFRVEEAVLHVAAPLIHVTDPAAPEGKVAIRLVDLLFDLHETSDEGFMRLAELMHPDFDDVGSFAERRQPPWHFSGADLIVIHMNAMTDFEVVAPTFHVLIAQHDKGQSHSPIVTFDHPTEPLAVSLRASGDMQAFVVWADKLCTLLKMHTA